MKNRFARMKFFIFHSFVRDKGMTIKSVFLVETSHCGVSEYIRKYIHIQNHTAINPADGRRHNVTSLLKMPLNNFFVTPDL